MRASSLFAVRWKFAVHDSLNFSTELAMDTPMDTTENITSETPMQRKPSRKQHDRQYDTTKKNPIGGAQFYHMQSDEFSPHKKCKRATISSTVDNLGDKYGIKIRPDILRYFHDCNEKEAEKLLTDFKEHGNFLWRRSQKSADTYTLSVLCNGEVMHLEMKHVGSSYSLGDGIISKQFESPYEVMKFHLINSSCGMLKKRALVVGLVKPLVNANSIKAMWYHDNPPEMLLKGKGSFLVSPSYKSPGDHLLWIRFGDKTIKCKEIHSEGKQFDIGDGKKFNSVEDLINYYKKNSLTVSGGARILLDKEVECSTTDIGDEIPTPLYATEADTVDGPVQIDWDYMWNVRLVTSGNRDSKKNGVIQVISNNGQYSLNLDGRIVRKDYKQSLFRLYRAIVSLQVVICLESDYYKGEYIKWNINEKSIGFYHGKPVSPPSSEMCVSWNLMAPSSDFPSYSSMKVLRAWTTQLDPAHPQSYFLNFVKSTATITYTPTLVQDYDSAISLMVEKAN
ncbi:tyrosine-protein phosphatase non-receptor type 11-like [Dysidea avara]|uniref:tyrosine-protein phosphatase non-receptor type 11-like n=1 Tax=Dysidea avara TaxID=196820 RepID=UPI00331BF49B